MSTPTGDRPIDSLREAAIDQLILNYGHGKLSLEAFERRLEAALDASDHAQLETLTADLELQSDSGYLEQKRRALATEEPSRDRGEPEYIVHVLGGGDRSGRWMVPAEVRVINVMGGTDLDFSDAEFSQRTVRVRLLCVMGGIDIKVPEGVNVDVKVFCIFGGIGNKTPGHHNPDAPTLIIDGLVLMGGADVKVKRSRKDRLLRFADDVKAMFDEAGR